nr:family 43 glycosylhydrolase [Clostridiales bacterium]
MEKDIRKTFINPIVIPDYPVLSGKKREMPKDVDFAAMRNPGLAWGRGGKPMIDIETLMAEDGHEYNVNIGDVMNFAYGKAGQNDVRATADPSAYYFDGKWYLYITSGAVYESDDLVNWTVHHEDSWMPISAPMAPTVEEYHGKYYGAANNTPLFVSDNPIGPWTLLGDWTLPDGREFVAGDVMIFRDDDDRLYLYFGLGPCIMGAELDPEQPNKLLTKPKVLVPFNKENYWERFGACNEDWSIGFIEGSWMVKHGTKYYLVYSCSGTEYYAYAMGAYTSDSPLG